MSALVEIRDVTKTYRRGGETIEVLHGLDLDIPRGEFLALMGPSGSGKTTLLNLIGGLDTPTAGSITVAASASTGWRRRALGLARRQRRLRLPVLQPAAGADRPSATSSCPCCSPASGAAERRRQAAIALTAGRPRRSRAAQARASCRAASSSASAIARAIVSDPTLLVCDEPTGDLDRDTADEILLLLQMLNREHGKTIVMVTHDPQGRRVRARAACYLDKGTLAPGAGADEP